MDLDVANTAHGRLQTRKKMDFILTARKFTQEEWDAMCASRNVDTADQVDNEANVSNDIGDNIDNDVGAEQAI